MPEGANSRFASLVSSLQSAKFVGSWEHNVTDGHVTLDGDAANLLIGDRSFAERPIPLSMALNRLHPEDRKWVLPKIENALLEGGGFIADYRVQSSEGFRRILDSGNIWRDKSGHLRGRGIFLDITNVTVEENSPKYTERSPSNDLTLVLDALQRQLGHRSARIQVLLEMLRIEVKRSNIQG